MSDIIQSPEEVIIYDNLGHEEKVQFGESVEQGDWVYLSTDGKYYRAQNDGTLLQSQTAGMALNKVRGSNGYGYIAKNGTNVDVGGILTVGETYYASSNAGRMCPYADVGSGKYVTSYGVAVTTTKMKIAINASGIQKA